MTSLAARTMELAIAHFPSGLMLAEGTAALRCLVPDLMPGLRLYFECRLGGADRAIDVSQHFFARDDQRALLDLALRHDDPVWTRIAAFARQWPSEPAITEIGLEHDCGVGAPAVFAAFGATTLRRGDAAERFVATVAPDARDSCRASIAALELAETCGLTSGRMIGVMLSRDAQVRCMVRSLSVDRVRDFLRAMAWRGDVAAVLDLVAVPQLGGEATRLVFGFSPGMDTDWGIEIIHDPGAKGDAERAALLDWLAGRGLAEPSRVAALAEWPGAIRPGDSRAPWPETMMLRDLAGGTRSWFECAVSHVKLNVRDACVQPAKVYLTIAPVHVDA